MRMYFKFVFLVILVHVSTVCFGTDKTDSKTEKASTAVSTNSPPAKFKLVYTETSPEESFKLVYYKEDPEYPSETQIWLEPIKSTSEFKKQLLFTHWNRAHSLISDDEQFIALNHHAMSNYGLLHVFIRNKEGLFTEVKKDFHEATRKLIAKDTGSIERFDHSYVYADCWLRDGLLMAHFVGRESGEHYIDPWYFIYDAKNDKFIMDLKELNKNVFHKVEKDEK